MRVIFILLGFLLVSSFAYNPVKSNDRRDKEKSLSAKSIAADKAKAEEADKDDDIDESLLDDDVPSEKEQRKKAPKLREAPSDYPQMSSDDFFEEARLHRLDGMKKSLDQKKPVDKSDKKDDEDVLDVSKESNDDDDNTYEACADDRELCHCDLNELNCGSVVMDSEDDLHLRTANLEIMKKNFVVYVANFSSNGIVHLREKLILPDHVKTISVLDFSYNQIQHIDSNVFSSFKNLTKLNLSHNKIGSIKKEYFAGIGDTLHKLDLGYNSISKVSEGVFDGLGNLKKLILDGNKITKWSKKMFRGLKKLEELSIDDCKISELDGDIFDELPNLKELSLRSNPIEKIPPAISNIEDLTELDLSETKLTELHESALGSEQTKLVELYMEDMPQLYSIHSCAFCGLPSLKLLDLSGNKKLALIHGNAFGFQDSDAGKKVTKLETLRLHNCNLTTIDESIINWDKVSELTLGGNPINCSCDTDFLMGSPRFTFKMDAAFPRCETPEELKGRNLASLNPEDACGSKKDGTRTRRIGTAFTVTLLVVFGVVGIYLLVSSGKLQNWATRLRVQIPQVSYSNLTSRQEETVNLDGDFDPRPAEV